MYGFSRNHLGRIPIPSVVPSPALQQVGWAPTNEQEAEDWALEQAHRWADPKVRAAIGTVAANVKNELAHDIELRPPMTDDESVNWTLDYLYQNGPPRSAEDGAQMLRRFLDQQGVQMGVHPAFVMATDLLVDFPLDDPGKALQWSYELGASFAQQFGIPLSTDLDAKSVIVTSATAGLTQAGVPFAGALMASAESLFDGTVTHDELRSLAGMVGSMVGATVGQMFGIPAPIGSFIGSVVTTLIFDGLGKLFGWGPSARDLRNIAFAAAKEAALAKRVECIMLGSHAWTQYQNYWYQLEQGLQQSINAQSFWLQHGLRYFENAYVDRVQVGPEQCKEFSYEQLAAAARGEEIDCTAALPAPIRRSCEDVSGCLYFSKYNQPPGLWLRHDPRGFLKPGHTHPDAMPDVEYAAARKGAMIGGRLSARAALLFYGAYEFVTPYQAYRTFVILRNYRQGTSQLSLLAPGRAEKDRWGNPVRTFESALQTDRTYIEAMSYVPVVPGNEFGGRYALGDCDTQRWAVQLFDSLLQCGPAAALVSRDISATISAAVVEYKIAAASRQQTVEQQAADAARTRRDLLTMRRERQRRSRSLNGGLIAAGGGALAGWSLASLLKSR